MPMIPATLKKLARPLKPALIRARRLARLAREDRYEISYAQLGEDILISAALSGFFISRPVYLDIGAHEPTYLSNTYLFYLRGSQGVCVEPDPVLCNRIRKKRSRDKCLNVGIGVGEEKTASLYVMSWNALNTFSQEEAEEIAKDGTYRIDKIVSVPLTPVNVILESHFPQCPDLVSLDAEGLDLEILRTLDFSKYRPKVFCIETMTYSINQTGTKRQDVIGFMQDNHYFVYADTSLNTIFVDKIAWDSRFASANA